MAARNGNGIVRRIDAGHRRPKPGQGLRYEAATATDIEHRKSRKGLQGAGRAIEMADEAVADEAEPGRPLAMERAQLAGRVPPLAREALEALHLRGVEVWGRRGGMMRVVLFSGHGADTGGNETECQGTGYCGKGGMSLRERRNSGIPVHSRQFAPPDGRSSRPAPEQANP